jgi:3-methyladenine DNA glycosylase/8-oxoguanine DNA glycosylase
VRGRRDGVTRLHRNMLTRLLHVDGEPVVVHAWQRRSGEVAMRAVSDGTAEARERALERMRFALGVDDDLSGFYAAFRRDPFLGPAIRRRPWLRPTRRPFAWEALAWAITEQLIESSRAAAIQRRLVRRWGAALAPPGARGAAPVLRDVPRPDVIASLAPAELAACDLAPARALAMIRCAREIASGRADPADPAADARFLRIREIGPWTLQCLRLLGRGEPDALPAGDLAYVKLVGVIAGLGRRAMVSEVEEFYARYEPYRGLAGIFSLSHYGWTQSRARGLPLAPDYYADAA